MNNKMQNKSARNLFILIAFFALFAWVAGCDDDHDEDHEHDALSDVEEHGHTPEEGTCEHQQEGPAVAVTAAVDADSSPEDISATHTRFDITFVDVEGGKGGVVQIQATAHQEFVFAPNKEVPFQVLASADLSEIPMEESVQNDHCEEVVSMSTFELEVGTYYVSFGPTEETEVSLVVARVDHEDHDHEDHDHE